MAAVIGVAPLAAQNDDPVTAVPETSPDETTVENPAPQETDDEPPVINLMITVPRGEVSPAQVQACEDRADAGRISGEIVVCRQIGEDPDNLFSGSREEAQKRYAESTAFSGDPATPNVAGGGIFSGPATISGQCFLPPCPDAPALLIDVEALPEAPPGSNADRIGRGLPPLSEDEPSEEEIRERRRALGLPEPKFQNDNQ